MTAITETRPTPAPFTLPRGATRMVCAICADTMVAAEASAFSDNVVSYLWTCDTCGHGFVTRHTLKDCPDTPQQDGF